MKHIDEVDIQRIKNGADIVTLIQSFVVLRKSGVEFKGLCPFHNENSPSFHVHPVKKIYKCFGCGAGGNVFRFFMDRENLRFPEAVRRVAQLTHQRLD